MSELRFESMKIRGADLGPQACVPDLIGEHILQNLSLIHIYRAL